MRIAIVTDAWSPQVNGVVRTLASIRQELVLAGHEVCVLSPDLFPSAPCPTYPEIRLALASSKAVGRRLEAFGPDSLHIATEGPLGVAARGWALRNAFAFTTAYHTQFPDYLSARTRLPSTLFWRYVRWFHGRSSAVLVSTPTMAKLLHGKGLKETRPWGRGVNLERFNPQAEPHPDFASLERPIQLYVGRIAIEKNVEAFLANGCPGSKVVVGSGPELERLMRLFPTAVFLGGLEGRSLGAAFASADVFVFPSKTDTYGLVIIEALACGTPVAAFPVPGPSDLLAETVGAMNEDLDHAISVALTKDRAACAAYGKTFSWKRSAEEFAAALVPLRTSSEAEKEAASASSRRQSLVGRAA